MGYFELLDEANSKIIDFGSKDASDIVAKLNLRYGLGKIIWSLKKRGVDTKEVFAVTTPDSGITRNKERWQAGFSYGCLIRWPSKEKASRLFAFPQIKPNACGMLVAKIKKAPLLKELCEALHSIERNGLRIGKEKIRLNIGISNHFIEICKVSKSKTKRLKNGDIVAIIHTSPCEYKSYLYDFSSWEKEGGVLESTPLGDLLVLEDKVAENYLKKYKMIEDYSIKKRLLLAEGLFGDFEVVSNPTHQGLFADNEARLGLYYFESSEEILPVTFSWDIHVYLMYPKRNLSDEVTAKSVESGEIREKLKNLNMLPHGGGYRIPFSSKGWRVVQNGSKRLFSYKDKQNEFIFSTPSEIPYHYRGLQIVDEITKLKLGSVAAKLKQIYTLKY